MPGRPRNRWCGGAKRPESVGVERGELFSLEATELVQAWSLAEGDVLPGGETVVALWRNPIAEEVTIVCDDGERVTTHRETRVVVAYRAVNDAPTRPGWRVGVFVATVRGQRRR